MAKTRGVSKPKNSTSLSGHSSARNNITGLSKASPEANRGGHHSKITTIEPHHHESEASENELADEEDVDERDADERDTNQQTLEDERDLEDSGPDDEQFMQHPISHPDREQGDQEQQDLSVPVPESFKTTDVQSNLVDQQHRSNMMDDPDESREDAQLGANLVQFGRDLIAKLVETFEKDMTAKIFELLTYGEKLAAEYGGKRTARNHDGDDTHAAKKPRLEKTSHTKPGVKGAGDPVCFRCKDQENVRGQKLQCSDCHRHYHTSKHCGNLRGRKVNFRCPSCFDQKRLRDKTKRALAVVSKKETAKPAAKREVADLTNDRKGRDPDAATDANSSTKGIQGGHEEEMDDTDEQSEAENNLAAESQDEMVGGEKEHEEVELDRASSVSSGLSSVKDVATPK